MEKHYLDYEGLENFRQVQKITDQVLVDNNSILLLDGDQFDVYLMPEKCVVYILSNGASVYKRGCFYEVTHTEISNPSGNPRSNWYYEKVPASYFTVMGLGPKAAAALADTLYTRSQDTSVNPGKTYYDRNRSYLFNKLAYAQILGTMPTAGSAWDGYCVYYRGEDTADYKKGHTYYCSGSGSTYTWTDISLKGIQVTVLPTASADELGNIYQYVGVTDTDYTHGYFYKCVSDGENPASYSWEEVMSKIVVDNALSDVSENPVQNKVVKGAIDTKQEILQYETLPVASAEWNGKIIQYIGSDSGIIHKGYFYICRKDSDEPEVYSWHGQSVQYLPFASTSVKGAVIVGDGLDIDGSGHLSVGENYKKVFQGTLDEWNALTPTEQALYDYLASPDEADGGRDIYSTTETKTNKVWIDGKPIYRKVIEQTLTSGVNTITHNLGIERYVDVFLSKGNDLVSSSDMQQIATYRGSDYNMCPYNLSKDKLYIACVGWTGYTVIILEYTKTTD